MNFCHFTGIDIAKDSLDWAVYTQEGRQLSTHTPNTRASKLLWLASKLLWLASQPSRVLYGAYRYL